MLLLSKDLSLEWTRKPCTELWSKVYLSGRLFAVVRKKILVWEFLPRKTYTVLHFSRLSKWVVSCFLAVKNKYAQILLVDKAVYKEQQSTNLGESLCLLFSRKDDGNEVFSKEKRAMLLYLFLNSLILCVSRYFVVLCPRRARPGLEPGPLDPTH